MQDNLNQLSRRNFLAVSGAATAASLAGTPTGVMAAQPAPAGSPVGGSKKHPIGLELYSVRTELSRDLPKTIQTVAKMGYEVVEFYAPYVGWTLPYAKEVRALLEDNGLRCYSTHNPVDSLMPGPTMAKAIELNQILGTRHIIIASAPAEGNGVEAWKKLCNQLTTAVDQLKPHGLSAGFHNHQTEWAKLDGETRVMDFLAANTPKEFVLQLDVGTCMEAGADAVAWIKANPGRIKIVHLKDWAPGTGDDKGYRVLFGEGTTPWKEIIAALEAVGGIEFYLLEQEGSRFSEFETAKRCLDNWRSFRAKG